MASPASHLWYQLLAGPDALLGARSSGRLGISAIPSTSSNWQFVPSNAAYTIRNEAFGPFFQLGLTPPGHEPSLVFMSSSSTEQKWDVRFDDSDDVRIQNVALGDRGYLNISGDEWGIDSEVWKMKPVKAIEAPFLTSAQVCFLFNKEAVYETNAALRCLSCP